MPLFDIDPETGGPGAVGAPPVGNPVWMGGTDGTNLRALLVDATGRPVVVGAGTAGVPSGGVLSIQGVSGGQTLPVTAAQGAAAAGSSRWPVAVTDTSDAVVRPGDAVNNAIRVNLVAGGGSGGTSQADRSSFVDGTGIITPIGGVRNDTFTSPAEDQAAAVRITANRELLTSRVNATATGALNALNAAVTVSLEGRHGAAVQFIAGSLVGTVLAEFSLDGGTNWAQTVFKQTNGVVFRPFTFGGFTSAYSIPVPEGTTHVRVRVSAFTGGTTTANLVATTAINSIAQERANFSAFARTIAIGNNKSMISILNAAGSGVVVRIHEIWIVNTANTPLTGVVSLFTLRRITGHSAGTAITPQEYDTGLPVNAAISVQTGATEAGAGSTALWEAGWSSDEWGTGTLDQEGYDHGIQVSKPWWRAAQGGRPIVLYAGQGLSVRHLVNSTAGQFDLWFVFSQE